MWSQFTVLQISNLKLLGGLHPVLGTLVKTTCSLLPLTHTNLTLPKNMKDSQGKIFLNQTHTKPAFSSHFRSCRLFSSSKKCSSCKRWTILFFESCSPIVCDSEHPHVFALWQLEKQYRYLMKSIFAHKCIFSNYLASPKNSRSCRLFPSSNNLALWLRLLSKKRVSFCVISKYSCEPEEFQILPALPQFQQLGSNELHLVLNNLQRF